MARNANTLGLKEQNFDRNANQPNLHRQRLFAKAAGIWTHGLFYNMDDGRVVGPLIGWGYPIQINHNWISTLAIATDLFEQTGMMIDPASDHALFVEFWEGSGDPDDYMAFVMTPLGSAILCPFDTAPAFGSVVYIIDAWTQCSGGSFSFQVI